MSMKKIIPFILLLAISACRNKPTETDTKVIVAVMSPADLSAPSVEKPDTINFTGADGLKQGHWIEFKDNMKSSGQYSRKVREGNYHNSLKNGLWLEYYDNEKLKSKITYANGKLEGYAAFYDKMQNVIKEGNYKNGAFVEKGK